MASVMGNSNLRHTNPNAETPTREYSPLNHRTEDSGVEVSSVNMRRTIPPTTTSVLLSQVEILKSQKRDPEGSIKTTLLSTLHSWGQDLVLTYEDRPELIEEVAKVAGVEPKKVGVHIALCNGYFFQAVFVDGHIRQGRAAKDALKLVPWSEFIVPIQQAMSEGQEALTLSLEEI